MTEISQLAQEVKLKGISRKEKWLNQADEDKAREIIKSIKPSKGDKKSWLSTTIKSHIIKLIKLDYKNLSRSFFFTNLAKRLELKKIAEEIFESKAELLGIDFYHNPISDSPVLDWHCDTSYSGAKNVKNFLRPEDYAVKFFFYLTDVSTDNGCLSYIPTSNKITYALKKGIFERAIKYSPYWSLKEFRKTIQIKDNYNYIKDVIGENILSEFLTKTNFIEEENSTNHSFDNEMGKGGCLIFDETGIHRGSKTKLSERMALRFFYKKKF
tara:strand:+ start:1660 stop:2466 length:807 start_codon:yes stop_codon:yes gene_type:complete